MTESSPKHIPKNGPAHSFTFLSPSPEKKKKKKIRSLSLLKGRVHQFLHIILNDVPR